MFQALHIAATRVGVPPSGGTCDRLKPGLQRGPAQARKNVQIASGCIRKWYESSEGVSRCYCEVHLQQRIAAMPLPVVDETRTSKSCIKNDLFGGPRRSETAADSLAWRAGAGWAG